jgi:hypothetical protein
MTTALCIQDSVFDASRSLWLGGFRFGIWIEGLLAGDLGFISAGYLKNLLVPLTHIVQV